MPAQGAISTEAGGVLDSGGITASALSKTLRRLVKYAMDGMISFSYKPLKASMWLGFTVSAISFLLGVYYFIDFLRHREKYGSGFTTLILCMLFLGGVQLITIGILGEYIGRIYEEIKQRPLYVVAEKLGIEIDGSATFSAAPNERAPLPQPAEPPRA